MIACGLMSAKQTAKNLVVIFVAGFCLSSGAAAPPDAESVSIFSNWMMYPATGDCEGHTLTLVRHKDRRLIRGYLQAYEGNCEDSKVPIKNVKVDRDKGTFSFTADSYVQDGKGGLEVFAEWRFVGVIAKNGVTGTIEFCPVDSHSCNTSEKISLPAVTMETP